MPKKREFDFSPSACYEHHGNRMAQSMRYCDGDVSAWQGRLRRTIRRLVGLGNITRAPLNVTSLWKKETAFGTIEKIVYTSEPRADVPAYICIPGGIDPPYPLTICVQGHTSGMHLSIGVQREDETAPMTVDNDLDFAVGCMKRGIAALCIEQRCLGERKETRLERMAKHGCLDATGKALMLGRTLLGDKVFDVDRGIDYLMTRNDIDGKRIGILGHSVGGAVAVFSAALLHRIRFAIPSCYFCTFKDSILAFYHCAEHCIPGLYQYADTADIMGLFAPRPVVLVAGREDHLFPVRGTRAAFKQLKRIYEAADARDRCHLVVGDQGHRFYADRAWRKMLPEIRVG